MVCAVAKQVCHHDEAAGEEGPGVAASQQGVAAHEAVQVIAQNEMIGSRHPVGADGERLSSQYALHGAKFHLGALLYSLSLAEILTEGHGIRICDKRKPSVGVSFIPTSVVIQRIVSITATVEGFSISVSNNSNLIPTIGLEGRCKNTKIIIENAKIVLKKLK